MDFKEFMTADTFDDNTSFAEWWRKVQPVMEATTASRYAVEVNFRSKIKEVLEQYAKIALGYVSAGLKQNGYHVKLVFEENPVRILVSSRNWDDGEWVGLVHFHPEHDGGSFIVSRGFYNKDRKTVSIQKSKKADGDAPSDLVKEVRNLMHELGDEPDRHIEKLRPVPMKRGPKRYGT